MLTEPSGYILEYEISALFFLIIIMVRYLACRKFPNQKNSLFIMIYWTAVANLILDIFSSVTINNALFVPVPVTLIVNGLFYSTLLLLLLLMTTYTLAMSEHLNRDKLKQIYPVYFPGALAFILMLSNPFTKFIFYVDPQSGYIHGVLFKYLYLVCLFYLVATFVFSYRARADLKKYEFLTVSVALGIVLIATIVQFIIPKLVIIGVAIAIAVILMYFTIQNPDDMLDTATGAFTYEAMLAFLHDRILQHQHVQIVAIKVRNISRINDLLGIENGSALLKQICNCMQKSADDSWVFRMRGNSFVAITMNRESYNKIYKSLEDHIDRPWKVSNIEIMLQATVCCIDTEALQIEPILPDDAVYYINTVFRKNKKSSELIKIVNVDSELLKRIIRRRLVEEALSESLEEDKYFEIYLQPIWSVLQGKFTNAEVLLRFIHPTLGFISPDEFVPIAESNGLITKMDEMVVRKTCAFIRDNDHLRGLGLNTIEINISALEFMHSQLPVLIHDIINEYQIDSEFLCFEITETAAFESFDLLKEYMLELVKIGCKFALDDFGTGYANISKVIQLPFSIVKLDKTLLQGAEVIIGDLARMFAGLELSTVIEGIETDEQVEMVIEKNIDYIQGFYYARPMAVNDFMNFMKKQV